MHPIPFFSMLRDKVKELSAAERQHVAGIVSEIIVLLRNADEESGGGGAD